MTEQPHDEREEQHGPGPDDVGGEPVISQWEFIDRVPTREDVIRLLETVAPVWGVHAVEIADYVQALPQAKKIKVPHPSNPSLMVDERHECYVLYVSVAGRQKMLDLAAQRNGWRVDIVPEPVTPTGIPGFLSDGTDETNRRIVYREYIEIHAPIGPRRLVTEADNSRVEVAEMAPLGRKPGMAWVPYSGGSQAAGSNPYEKVETAARGRALAAWGFGVLPGSGVASVEEIQGASLNRASMQTQAAAEQIRQRQGGPDRKPREDLLGEAMMAAEELRQIRGIPDEVMDAEVAEYMVTRLGVKGFVDEDGKHDWAKVKDGQIVMFTNAIRKRISAEQGL